MKKLTTPLVWIIIGVLALVPIIYFLLRLSKPVFIDNAMGNWFATMIGALIGILSALKINKLQQEIQERKELKAKDEEEKDRKTKILKLIKKELLYNLDSLFKRKPKTDEKTKRSILINRLKDELWNAFSDGGELQWIKDLQLLDFISNAYYHIRTIIFLEEKYFDATHFSGMRMAQKEYPEDRILKYLNTADIEVTQSIEQALKEIEKSLASLENRELF